MTNRVVADKLRAGAADQITLGELAHVSDLDLVRRIPEDLVRAGVRALFTRANGLIGPGPLRQGMVNSWITAGNDQLKVADVELVREIMSDPDAYLDVWVPMWNFFKADDVLLTAEGESLLKVTEPEGWLRDQLWAITGDKNFPAVLRVENVRHEDLNGKYVLLLQIELVR